MYHYLFLQLFLVKKPVQSPAESEWDCLLSGWTLWAPFTLVIVGCMGFVMGLITEKKQGFRWYLVAMAAACVIKIAGYYIAEGIIYGNWVTPATSIPGNLLQIGVAAVIVAIVIVPLKKAANKLL